MARSKLSNTLLKIAEEHAVFIVFAIIVIVAAICLPKFRTPINALVVIRQFSMIAIVAIGQGVVLISGGFDLSVGAIASLCGMASGYFLTSLGMPVWLGILLGVLVGNMCGLFNGMLVSFVRINPLIATLASSWIFNGIVLVTTKGWPISNLPSGFGFLGQGKIFSIPVPIWLMVLVALFFTILLGKTVYGRNIYALGGSEITSIFVGINVKLIKLSAFAISGTLAGFAGIILTSRLATAQAGAAEQWTLPSVAAAVIGGLSLYGGEGKIYRVILGAALMGVISNILVLFRVSSYWQSLISGFILITAVAVGAMQRSK
ncbi:MAG: ABC transporter permease [Desulfobacterales bacterium]|jgi:ribose transport system permease protein